MGHVNVVEHAPYMSPACGFDDPAGFVEMMESSIGIGLQNTGEEAQMLLGMFSGLDFGEPLHAGGTNLGDPMLEGSACDLILNLAITQGAFEGDELPPLESLGKLREISPGEDPMPFGSGFRSRLCRSSSEKYTSGSTTYKVQN